MQATVHRFDLQTGSASVITDDGLVLPVSSKVFAAGALRHLRLGQRVTIVVGAQTGPPQVTHLALGTVGRTAPPSTP